MKVQVNERSIKFCSSVNIMRWMIVHCTWCWVLLELGMYDLLSFALYIFLSPPIVSYFLTYFHLFISLTALFLHLFYGLYSVKTLKKSLGLFCELWLPGKGLFWLLFSVRPQAQWSLRWLELALSDEKWPTQTLSYNTSESHYLALLRAPLGAIWSRHLLSENLMLFV